MRPFAAAILPIALGFAIAPACFAAGASLPAATLKLDRIGAETERVSAIVAPKVVQVVTQSLKVATGSDSEPTGMLISERGRGSGFFVAADGYLLTNAHVVANAIHVRVVIPPPAGSGGTPREFPATVVGSDTDSDLALLKIDIQDAPFFDLSAGAAPRQGQLVLAYGSPMGLAQSASLGLVSAIDRQFSPDDPRTYIQTDASMNPGNSGGPLVDLDGKLLGISTMILTQSGGSEGLGFAVPLECIRRSYDALRASGIIARPRLGLQPRALTADLVAGLGLKTNQGVLVEDVAPYGPAALGGLLPGDVLVALGGEAVHNVRDLYRAELALSPGKAAGVSVMRGPNLCLLEVTPAPGQPDPPAFTAASVTERNNLVFRLGLYGVTLTPAIAASLGGSRGGPGVLVIALAGSGLAAQNALQPGDVVHAVNAATINSVESLRAAMDARADGRPVVLQIERGGMLSYVTPEALPAADQRLKKSTFIPGGKGIAERALSY